jgi:uncharacterized protein YjdB
MKKFLFMVLLSALIAGCSDDDDEPEVIPVTSVQLDKSQVELQVNETYVFKVTYLPATADKPVYEWSSGNSEVATVSGQGEVTAISVGEAVIKVTATSLGKTLTASCTVKVLPISVSGITLNKTSLELLPGAEETLTYTITPETATNKEVEWSSLNPEVATVENGLVKAISVGETTIEVSTKDGQMKAACSVKVNPIAVTGIELSKTLLELLVGAEETLTYTIEPETASDKEVDWESLDPDIATVENGTVKGVSPGETTIEVSSKDGQAKTTCTVKVNPVAVTGITLDQSEVELINGSSIQLNATITPENATDQKVNWSSSNSSVASVSQGRVTALSVGETIITATSSDGNYTASCTVTVIPVPASGISLNKSSLSLLVDETNSLIATVQPDNAANKSVTWSSSDQNIVTVDADGNIQAIAIGTAQITATTDDGGYTAICNIEVVSITSKIKLYFPSSSVVNINGYITGSIYSAIVNQSPYSITLTKFAIIDSNSGAVKAQTSDVSLLGILISGSSKNLGSSNLNNVYLPIFKWYFTYDGNDYSVQHQYK